jgi:hypothetical protein
MAAYRCSGRKEKRSIKLLSITAQSIPKGSERVSSATQFRAEKGRETESEFCLNETGKESARANISLLSRRGNLNKEENKTERGGARKPTPERFLSEFKKGEKKMKLSRTRKSEAGDEEAHHDLLLRRFFKCERE